MAAYCLSNETAYLLTVARRPGFILTFGPNADFLCPERPCRDDRSGQFTVSCSVSLCSVLGSIEFITYSEDAMQLVDH